MKAHTYKIQGFKDREALVVAFANSGYKVKVIEKVDPMRSWEITFYVQVSK
jgi:hypothetical protein